MQIGDDKMNIKRCTFAIKRSQKQQRKLTITIISMTLAFYLTWIMYAINCLLTMAGVVNLPRASHIFAVLVAKSGIVINPIIYIFYNKDVSTFRLNYRVCQGEMLQKDKERCRY